MNTTRSLLAIVLCSSLLAAAPLMTGCPPPPPPNHLFAVAIIADPHVTGEPGSENARRLAACVDWINAHREELRIELTLVVGDLIKDTVTWEGKEILDTLAIPYVPIFGDNEVHTNEAFFASMYALQYDYLATIFDNWTKAPSPVWNPEFGRYSYFQNFSFDYRDIHFVGLDWCSRSPDWILGELADLHDFEGGTLPWFMNDIANCQKSYGENIIMVSHHPMHAFIGAFTAEEDAVIENFTAAYGDYVYADLAGHYHVGSHETRTVGQYELYVNEATIFGLNNVALLRVYNDGQSFSYYYENVILQ